MQENTEEKLFALPGERYVNKKTQKEYQLAFIATDSEDQTAKAVYVSVEPDDLFLHRLALVLLIFASRLLRGVVWVRPIDLFEQKFEAKTYSKD